VRSLSTHQKVVAFLAFRRDGRQLVAATGDTLQLWDLPGAQESRTFRGHADHIYTVVFSPDGRRLASASADRTVILWDPASSLDTLTLRGHTHNVYSVAFSPDGRRLASGSADGTV